MNAPGLDPLTKLYNFVRVSERMNGVEVRFTARGVPLEASAPRVVIIPVDGTIGAPDHDGNVADVTVNVECRCWGRDFPGLWEVLRRTLMAFWDYGNVGDEVADETADGVVDCLRITPTGIEFDDETDTNRDGRAAVLSFDVIAAFERTPLAEDAGVGTVDAVVVAPA